MSLLRYLLHQGNVLEDKGSPRMLKLLIGVTMSTFGQDDFGERTTREKSRGEDKKTSDQPVFISAEAEELFHQALRSSGQAQTMALGTLKESSSCAPRNRDVAGKDELQRRRLLRALVEAGIAGADGSLVVDAARALQIRPHDIVNLLTEVSGASVEDDETVNQVLSFV